MLVELKVKMNKAVRGFILFHFLYFILQDTFGITIKKPFAKDDSFVGLKCDSNSTAFEKRLKTILKCAVMCYNMDRCYGFYYKPDLMKCVGCSGPGFERFSDGEMLVRKPECPPGWKAWRRSCYFFGTEFKTWEEALRSCRQMSSELIEIDEAENHYLLSQIGGNTLDNYWIGLTQTYKNRTNLFIWNSSGDVLKFSSWNYDQPILQRLEPNEKEDCVYIYLLWGVYVVVWEDIPCNYKHKYICERQTPYV